MGLDIPGEFPYSGYGWPSEIGCDYKKFNISFWKFIPKHEDADKWVERAKNNVGSVGDVYIASHACSAAGAYGKYHWIKKHYPEFKDKIILIENKWLLANRATSIIESTMLIDDNVDNVEAFIRQGGEGILVPRPWNVDKEAE